MRGRREDQHIPEILQFMSTATGLQMILGYGLHGDALNYTVKTLLDTGATQDWRHVI